MALCVFFVPLSNLKISAISYIKEIFLKQIRIAEKKLIKRKRKLNKRGDFVDYSPKQK